MWQRKAGKITLSVIAGILAAIFLLAITETGFMVAASSKAPLESATVGVRRCVLCPADRERTNRFRRRAHGFLYIISTCENGCYRIYATN